MELKVIAMDQEFELLGYAALHLISHLKNISSSDMLAVLPIVLQFFHSGNAVCNWILGCYIASRGMKNAMAHAMMLRKLKADKFPIEFTILIIVFGALSYISSHGLEIFDEQTGKEVCRVVSDKSFMDDLLFFDFSLTNYCTSDVESALTKFVFKDSLSLRLQDPQEASCAEETRNLFWSKNPSASGIYPYGLPIQFAILIRLVLVNKCTKLLDHLVTGCPEILAKELPALMEFTTTVCPEEILNHLLTQSVLSFCNISHLLIVAVRANRLSTVRLLLQQNSSLVNSWAHYEASLHAAVDLESEELVAVLLDSADVIFTVPMRGSLHHCLLTAISKHLTSIVIMLLRFQAPISLAHYDKAMAFAINFDNPEVFQRLLDFTKDCSKSMLRGLLFQAIGDGGFLLN